MDVEGAERAGLMGCADLLKRLHPRLAICAYHKPEDLYELTQLIRGYGYNRFLLRRYTNGQFDVVLYAEKTTNH
jgi:hypothetical protein